MPHYDIKNPRLDKLNAMMDRLGLKTAVGTPAVWHNHERIQLNTNPTEYIAYYIDFDPRGSKERLFCSTFQMATGIGIIKQGFLADGSQLNESLYLFIPVPIFQQLTDHDLVTVEKMFLEREAGQTLSEDNAPPPPAPLIQ